MKIIIDNLKKENIGIFDYPDNETKKIEIKNVKYNLNRKDIRIILDNEVEDFICELIRENLPIQDLERVMAENF